MKKLHQVLVGNILIDPAILLRCLKKSCYHMSYDPGKETLEFSENDGTGGGVILEIRNISHESAVKLAESLGLKGDGPGSIHWSKWNPQLIMGHDGSQDAERLLNEITKLGIPVRVNKGELSLSEGQSVMKASSGWTVEKLIKSVQENAERNKVQLETAP